jgi:hypothetical protein
LQEKRRAGERRQWGVDHHGDPHRGLDHEQKEVVRGEKERERGRKSSTEKTRRAMGGAERRLERLEAGAGKDAASRWEVPIGTRVYLKMVERYRSRVASEEVPPYAQEEIEEMRRQDLETVSGNGIGALASFVSAYEAFIVPVLATEPTTSDLVAPGGAISSSAPFALLQEVGGLAYMLGLVMLGIAVLRSRVMPRWTGALMAVAPVFLLLPVPEAPVVTGLLIDLPRGLAVAGMGYTLFVREGEEPTNTPGKPNERS